MTASTARSVNITALEAVGAANSLQGKEGHVRAAIDRIAAATTSIDEANDIILICPLPSNAILLDLIVFGDDLDSDGSPALAANVGIYYSGLGGQQKALGKVSGDAVDVDNIGTAVASFQSAITLGTNLRFEAADIIGIGSRLWEVGGLTTDPGGTLYLGFKVSTAAATAAAGDIVVKTTYML